ncbi:hypothetical protein DCO57_17630 [Labrenzia sp. 011]|nr:hypothetical protein DCO57_17630 [Labrenzia sp. 011]
MISALAPMLKIACIVMNIHGGHFFVSDTNIAAMFKSVFESVSVSKHVQIFDNAIEIESRSAFSHFNKLDGMNIDVALAGGFNELSRPDDCNRFYIFYLRSREFIRREVSNVNPLLIGNYSGRSLTAIFNRKFNFRDKASRTIPDNDIMSGKVSDNLSFGSALGTVRSLDGKPDSSGSNNGTEDSQNHLSPCRSFLPLSGCSASFSGISSLSLGLQIGGLMIIGSIFAFTGVGGLFFAFYDDHRNWRWPAVVYAIVSLVGLTFFYAWGFMGHPGRLFGMG